MNTSSKIKLTHKKIRLCQIIISNFRNIFLHLQVNLVKGFEGDKEKLGNAEKFFSVFIQLPAFKIRIDGLVLKDEFRLTMDSLLPNITAFVSACQHLLENESFKVFLRYVLHAGNFMNAVSIIIVLKKTKKKIMKCGLLRT